MDYEVIFEISDISRIHYYTLPGVLGGMFIISLFCWLSTFGTARHFTVLPFVISLILTIVFGCCTVAATIDTTKTVHALFDCPDEKVCIVEGTVENCNTEYFYKKARGSFEVQGVTFDYGRTTGIPGYRGKHNYISENGQQVRIHYTSYAGENVILKIEMANKQT